MNRPLAINKLRIGLVVPHIFMQRDLLPRVIFSPAVLALSLVEELELLGADVTLYSPGPVDTSVRNITADLSGFEAELAARGDDYLQLLGKHPLTFVTLARQVQAELVAQAYADANAGKLDIVHVYTNEEELALITAQFCHKPVVFTHHDPFNFLVRYRSIMPRYRQLNWISMSLAQRAGMPSDTNWVGNIYHGLSTNLYEPLLEVRSDYVVFMGRMIEPKGLHLAISAIREHNIPHTDDPLRLIIAGKHYGASTKDSYWTKRIKPEIDGTTIVYAGFVGDQAAKQSLLAGARALVIPSIFDEPFGLVQVEALACGTPVVGLAHGAIAEVVRDGVNGVLVDRPEDLAKGIERARTIDRAACRADFEARFTAKRMAAEHLAIYQNLI